MKLVWIRVAAASVLFLTVPACTEGSDAGDGGESAGQDGGDCGSDEAGMESGSGESGSDSGSAESGSDQTGEQLFTSACSVCHGPEAEGTELGYELRHHSEEHFCWVVRNGRAGVEFESSIMAPYSDESIPDPDLDKILDFLDTFPQPTTPEGLYLDYCGNCHGPTGNEGVANKEIRGKSFRDTEEKVRKGIGGLDNVGVQRRFMPAFDTDRISNAELQLIVDFLGG